MINSNEIQLYKIGIKEIVECNAFEMSKCKESQYDIRYQNGWIDGDKINRCSVDVETIS